MRRTIALTITALMALALAPFGAARAQQGQIDPPELVVDITKPSAGSVSGAEVPVEVKITEDFGVRVIKEYWVRFENADGSMANFCHEVYGDGVDDSVTLTFTWDTNGQPTGDGVSDCDTGAGVLPEDGASAPLANGEHRITAYARLTDPFGQGPVEGTDSVATDVNNAPATPSGVKLKYQESSDKVTVSWNANPESGYDVVNYRVQECTVDRSSKPCGSWTTVDDVSDTSLAVKRTEPGIYRYRVVALRLNAAGDGWINSGAATPQSDPTEITVEEDPDPTTSTTEPGDDDDGEESSTTSEPETRTVVKPTRRVQRAAPQVLQRIVEEDPGYQDELPYENDDDEEAISGLPIDGNNEDGDGQLSTLVPLAGGLTLLIFALQLWYLNNRAGRTLEPIPVEAYGPDEGWDE